MPNKTFLACGIPRVKSNNTIYNTIRKTGTEKSYFKTKIQYIKRMQKQKERYIKI